jgi:hypothetical protein
MTPERSRARSPLAVGVAQEHPQHAAAIPHRALGQTGSTALGHEAAQDHRGQLRELDYPDPMQVGLEAIQVEPVGLDRGGSKAPLVGQVVEEPGGRLMERVCEPAASYGPVIGHDHLEEGLDGPTHLLHHRRSRCGTLAAPALLHALGHKGVDVGGQVSHGASAVQLGELAESHHQRHPGMNHPGRVTVLVQPGHVPLDLWPDPRSLDPVDGGGLDEVLLQHGNLLLLD